MEERNISPFSTKVVIQKQCLAHCFWVTTPPESATRLEIQSEKSLRSDARIVPLTDLSVGQPNDN
jgi:hypothetical protein